MVSITTSQLVRLTAAKSATNTSLRWVPFFLPTLAVAFDASTATLATVVGFGEMAGLSTLLIARRLDGGKGRLVVAFALLAASAASLVALHGSFSSFVFSFVAIVACTAFVSVGGHTWISSRVPFEKRARYIGVYEISWALALLVGAPLIALLIGEFGWRGPYVALAASCALLSIVILTMADSAPAYEPATTTRPSLRLTRNAWITMVASASIAMAGLSMIVVVGTWLDDSLGVSTGGVGLVAMAFGLAELTASSSSASFADRLGKRRTTQSALIVMLVGLGVVSVAGSSLPAAVFGLFFMFVGFEYAVVTSFSLVSESMPAARGRTLATSSAIGTVARGIGAGCAGVLYGAVGVRGPAAISAGAALVALTLLAKTSNPGDLN